MKQRKAKSKGSLSTVQVKIKVTAPEYIRNRIGANFLRDALTIIANGGEVPGVQVSEIVWRKASRVEPYVYTEDYEIEAALAVIKLIGLPIAIGKETDI